MLKLRETGRYGLLFANGGFATHNHTIIIGREPIAAARFPQNFDFQEEADADRLPVPPLPKPMKGQQRSKPTPSSMSGMVRRNGA